MPKQKHSIQFKKRRTRLGSYRYYSRSGRRISKQRYFSYLKRRKSALKSAQQERTSRKKEQKLKIKKSRFKGRYSQGTDYNKRCRISIGEMGITYIFFYCNRIWGQVKARFKIRKKLMYFRFSGFFEADNDRSGKKFVRATRLGFANKRGYADYGFRQFEITRTLEELSDMIGDSKYMIDDVIITNIAVANR